MKIFPAVILVLAFATTAALAQQTQPASTMAVQVSAAVGNMALELDQSRQTIQQLQSQLAAAQAQIKELEKPADK